MGVLKAEELLASTMRNRNLMELEVEGAEHLLFMEYLIEAEPKPYNKNLDYLKHQIKSKGLTTVEYLKLFEKKKYPSKPYGNLKTAVENIINKVCSEKIDYRSYGESQDTFLENVFKDMTKKS